MGGAGERIKHGGRVGNKIQGTWIFKKKGSFHTQQTSPDTSNAHENRQGIEYILKVGCGQLCDKMQLAKWSTHFRAENLPPGGRFWVRKPVLFPLIMPPENCAPTIQCHPWITLPAYTECKCERWRRETNGRLCKYTDPCQFKLFPKHQMESVVGMASIETSWKFQTQKIILSFQIRVFPQGWDS